MLRLKLPRPSRAGLEITALCLLLQASRPTGPPRLPVPDNYYGAWPGLKTRPGYDSANHVLQNSHNCWIYVSFIPSSFVGEQSCSNVTNSVSCIIHLLELLFWTTYPSNVEVVYPNLDCRHSLAHPPSSRTKTQYWCVYVSILFLKITASSF